MSDGIEALKAAYVSQMKRVYCSSIRGIATPEDCQQWEADADRVIRKVKAEAWDEGRASVGEQMLQPRDEFGMWPEVPNPYRGGSDADDN